MKAIAGVPGQGLVNLDPQASPIAVCWPRKDFLVDNHVHLFTYCQVIVFIRQQQSCSVLSPVRLLATPWTAAHQASLSFTISWSLLKLMSTESVMPFNHTSSTTSFSSCPQSFPAWGFFPTSQLFVSGGQSIRASALASVLPINIQGWFLLGLTSLISLLTKGLSRVFSSTTVW